jgi:hypothetical protein
MPKPTTHQGNLAKLPRALEPLIERKQWCVWRWTQKLDGSWQKPPFIATQPDRHASTSDANTWTNYPQPGAESDPAVTQTVMNVLKEVAQQLNCFVLGVDHYGKDVAAGTRGSSAKEASADLVLACLGDREQSGSVTNTRLAVRKCRGGPQGQEFYFAVRRVEDPVPDEDGDPITTLVIDWVATPAAAVTPQDPWAKPKRQDQRTGALRLKRVLMAILAEQGVELPIPPDGPIVRMVDQKFVRRAFYACTPTDEGTPERKGHFRRQKFLRALDWAEDEQLIAVTEINGVTYLRLTRPGEEESEN